MPAQFTVFNGVPFVLPFPAQSFLNVSPPPGCTVSVSSYTPLPACRRGAGQQTYIRAPRSACKRRQRHAVHRIAGGTAKRQ